MIRKLKDKVEHVLEKYPDTRNSDVELTIKIWEEFHSNMILTERGVKLIRLRALFELPREDNVKRVRAKIQNEEHRFLPTKLSIALKRGILEDVWRRELGYAPKEPPGQGRLFKSPPRRMW